MAYPVFNGLDPRNRLMAGDLHFSDSLERQERAYDDWKGNVVKRPILRHDDSISHRPYDGSTW